MIEIMNMRTDKPSEPWDVKVDRSSPLGNPFPMKTENHRKQVCDKYETVFDKIVVQGIALAECDVKFMDEVKRLTELYKELGKLRLFCWCAPLRCHAETIKAYLESVV